MRAMACCWGASCWPCGGAWGAPPLVVACASVMLALVIFSILYGVLVGTYLGVAAAGGLVARGAARPRCQRSTLDDVDRDRRRSGAPGLCQPGHRLAAPAFAHRAERARVGRHHPGRLLRWAGEQLCGADVPVRRWLGRPGARWSAGAALYQRAPVRSGAEAAVWPTRGWTEGIHWSSPRPLAMS